MKRYCLALLGIISLSACAQNTNPDKPADTAKPAASAAASPLAGPMDARMRAAVAKLNPRIQIDQVSASPLKGFQEVIVSGQTLYISDDGKYLMQGTLIDLDAKRDLSQDSLAQLRRKLLKTVPVADRIVFGPPNPKYTVSVFTDVECGFCRKLHSEMAEYNREGIEVQYLAFPRAGIGSPDFDTMVSVWCAPDRQKALTDSKNDRPVPRRTCKNPVTMEHDVGRRAGLTGTPMIIAENGVAMPGYMPPKELRAALDNLAAEADEAAGSR